MWGRSRIPAVVSIARALVMAAGLAALAPSPPAHAAERVITGIRLGEHASKTRIVLDVSERVAFNVFTLADPDRVVIDLPEVGWRLPAKALPRETGVVQTMRYGLFEPGRSRLVLAVATPVQVSNAFVLGPVGRYPYRLVVDLQATTRTAFRDSKAKRSPSSHGPRPEGVARAMGSAPRAAVNGSHALVQPFPAAPRKPARPRPRATYVIVIDPGHGGLDPGAIGHSGAYEKHFALAAAKEIKRALERSGRYRVVLTRDRDVFLRLRERVAVARDAGAELFISIHADAHARRTTQGQSVYTLSEKASDKEAAALAEKENKADLIAGIDLSDKVPEVSNILIDLAQRETMNWSTRFAAALVGEIRGLAPVLPKAHRFAGFAVLKAPDVPSVLVELGFLSNPDDERRLRSSAYRKRLAAAMVRAIDGYFREVELARRS